MLRGAVQGRSLVGRLIWLAAGWSLALLAATGIALSAFFYQAALSEFDQGLSEDIDSLYAGSSVAADGSLSAPALTDARATRTYSGKYWELAEIDGGRLRPVSDQRSRSLWDTEMPSTPNIAAQVKASKGRIYYYNAPGPIGQRLRVAVREALLPGRANPVIFAAAQDRGHIDNDFRRFATVTAAALLLLGVGLVAAVFLQVRFGLAPLFNIGREIAAVRKGKAQRLSENYPSEIAPLALEINALLNHNQEVVERQRTHVGNLAHALKTPISVMQAEAQATPGSLAAVVQRQARAMQDHVEHHLRRARAAARSITSGERTEVAPILDELSRMLHRIHPDGEIDWDAPDDLFFLGERQDLMEMIGNLMENACKWRSSAVWVTAEEEGAGRLRLVVEDDGPGLREDERVAVLKRGERLDESAPGSGLGLAIVDELVRAYGGSLTLSDSRLGGLKIELDLPRAEQ
jgi:signal transduction histidine kinase